MRSKKVFSHYWLWLIIIPEVVVVSDADEVVVGRLVGAGIKEIIHGVRSKKNALNYYCITKFMSMSMIKIQNKNMANEVLIKFLHFCQSPIRYEIHKLNTHFTIQV